jgi:hypothetical protein
MKTPSLSVLLVCFAVSASAQTNVGILVNQLALDASNRVAAYESGADMAASQQIYVSNYWNNSFWSSFWSVTTADSSTWQQQMRILKIHSTNCIGHLEGSTNWYAACTGLQSDDGQAVAITMSGGYMSAYTMSAVIDGRTLTETGLDSAAVWSALKTDLYGAWFNQNLCDPDGQYLTQDFTIINLSMPNASMYELATAGQGSAPDSSLLSLLMSNAQATNTSGLSTNTIDTNALPASVDMTNSTFDQDLATMKAAGAVIDPAAVRQPSDAITSIRSIYLNNATSPVTLRSLLLQALFNDIMNSGSWSGNTFRWGRLAHSRAYAAALRNYASCAKNLIAYYQIVIGELNTQLSDADQNDLTMLGMVGTYRTQLTQQDPIGTVITTAQAQQIFNSQVGNTSISIPAIGIGAYAMWLVGPPWAQTPCFPTTFGCIQNPLYNTIVAQLIRGLSSSGGITLMPQNAAMNTLKNATQQQNAVTDIQDLVTQQANNALLGQEKTNSYGDASYHIPAAQAPSSVSTLSLYANSAAGDPLVQSALAGAAAARQSSVLLSNQQQSIYAKMTGSGTMIERAALGNEQEVLKTSTMAELQNAINNRTSFKAMERNTNLMRLKDKQDSENAFDHSGIQ